jgi:hypothetical protein
MTETGKSNYPVRTPMGAQLTEDVVRDIAKLLETRGFPPFIDEDIGVCICCCTICCTKVTKTP